MASSALSDDDEQQSAAFAFARSRSRSPWLQRHGAGIALGVFALSLTLTVALALVQPLAHAHAYQLGVRVTAIVALVWYVSRFRAGWLEQPRFLWLMLALGLYFVVQRPLTVKPDSEILAAYASAFRALDTGQNPYQSGTIVHFVEGGLHKLGNFNYPPLELWPYYAVAKLCGRWDHVVLTLTLLCLQLGASGLLFVTFPKAPRFSVAALVPLLACYELYTNVALTFLFVALIVLVVVRQLEQPAPWQRPALWLLFGSGLMTKFLIAPLFAVYIWSRLSLRAPRSWLSSAVDFMLPVLIALLWMAPFGIANVFRETVLFNLVLRDRATLTTFYPNVLSGSLAWLGLSEAFSISAVLALGVGVFVAGWLPLLRGLLAAAIAFLLVSPTPEPQYVPVVIYLALAGLLHEAHSAHARAERDSLAREGESRSPLRQSHDQIA